MKLELGFVLRNWNLKMKQGLHSEYLWTVFAELNNGPAYTDFLKVLVSRLGLTADIQLDCSFHWQTQSAYISKNL